MKNKKILTTLILTAFSSTAFSNPFVVDEAAEKQESELSSMKSEVQFLKGNLEKLMMLQESIRKKEEENDIALEMTEEISKNLPPDPTSLVPVALGTTVELQEEHVPDFYSGFVVVNGDYFLKNQSGNTDLPYVQVSKESFMTRLVESKEPKKPESDQ